MGDSGSTEAPDRGRVLSPVACIIWTSIALLIIVDAVWLRSARIRVTITSLMALAALTAFLGAIALLYAWTGRSAGIARTAQGAAQLIGFSAMMALLSYAIASTSAPLRDARFASMDSALGFNWAAWDAFVEAHPVLRLALILAYVSMLPQMIACLLYVASRPEGSDEYIASLLIAGIATVAMAGLWPAIGHLPRASHVPHLLALRASTLHVIDLRTVEGLISFPSYHAAVAVLLAYAVRRQRVLFVVACVLNGAMLISTLSVGGHYLVDVIAGALVAALSAWAATRLAARTATTNARPRAPAGEVAAAVGG